MDTGPLITATTEARWQELFESAADYAVFTMTPDGTVDSWNRGAERVFGFKASEIVGWPVDVIFTPQDRANGAPQHEINTALVAGRAADERWHQRKDGTRFYCSGVMVRVGEGVTLGLAKIARDLTERETGEAAARLQQFVTAQEGERARIARNLHDHLGQQLTALRLTLERIADATVRSDELNRALVLVRDIDAAVDFLTWELHPALLDDLGLAAALPRFVSEWSLHADVAAECRVSGCDEVRLPKVIESTLYRIAQEALTNVLKHAAASLVNVMLECHGGLVTLIVEDNGKGFEPGATRSGLGLIGIRERAALVGATLEIESSPGRGTTLFVRLRLQTQGPHL